MNTGRRAFLKSSLAITGLACYQHAFPFSGIADILSKKEVKVSGHLWQYASKFPPTYDCTPILDTIFSDFRYAGIRGVELMDVLLKHKDAQRNFERLREKYDVQVTGTSFEAPMWNREEHPRIQKDFELIAKTLKRIGGKNVGFSVGYKPEKKTPSELDAQGEILQELLGICSELSLEPNLHNHTYEVADDMYDLRGTLTRVKDLKLGPDVAHLYRAGVDPEDFIRQFGDRISYLHLRDHNADKTWTEAVGEGVIDFRGIANALKDVGFTGDAAIELSFEGIPVRPLRENWKISRDFVREVFCW